MPLTDVDCLLSKIPSDTDGSVQKNLNINLVGQQNIVVPSPDLMKAFDQLINGWFAKMKQNEIESRNLANIRDALLPKLLSGELSVNKLGVTVL